MMKVKITYDDKGVNLDGVDCVLLQGGESFVVVSPKWISVLDSLPPAHKPFIGYGQDTLKQEEEIICMVHYLGGLDMEGYEMMSGFYALGQFGLYNREHSCNPTHWMELPKGPQ